MLQLTDVRVFLEVVTSGSFSDAARRLKMPKSSVGRQIERLEAEVGGALFRRSTRSVALTEEGRTFLPHARRLHDDSVEAGNVLRGCGRTASGQLSVSTTAPFARAFLIPHLPLFLARHPGVQLKLWLTPGRAEIGTAPGQVDVAIRLRSVAGPDLANRKLGEIGFSIVASPDYLATNGMPSEPADLASHRIVEVGPQNKAHQVDLHRDGALATVRYTPQLHIDDPEAVCVAAEAGAGIAVLPGFLAAPSLARGALVRVLDGWAPAPVPIHVLYATDLAPSLRVRAFVDFLFETIGRGMPWQS